MQVTLLAAMTANGMIGLSDDQSSMEWTSKEDKSHFVDVTKQSGVLIVGRKTFETFGKPLKDRKVIVMTRAVPLPPNLEGQNASVEFTHKSPHDILADLKASGHTSVVVGGGESVYSLFLREGLVTDVYLTIEPVLFGHGVPLAAMFGVINLELANQYWLNKHTIFLHYRVKKTS